VTAAERVAVIADVHGNAPALEAVLAEVAREAPEVVVSCGDLTWGAEPEAVYRLARDLEAAVFVRGNAERAVLEGTSDTPRAAWMQGQHDDELRAFVASFQEQAVVDVQGLGAVRFCHGSPRSDEECVTPATPEERVRKFMSGVEERVVASAHVHIQFDRAVAGIRSLNPGSVGLPYEGRPGAYWALLGPGVEHRRTEYDVDRAAHAYRESGLPGGDDLAQLLLEPPTPDEVIDDAEQRVFAG
jgi:putative phosphoesterase